MLLNSPSESRASIDAFYGHAIRLSARAHDAAAVRAWTDSLRSDSLWDLLRHRDPIGRDLFLTWAPKGPGFFAAHPTRLAALRAARTAVAVHRFRLAEGRVPRDLEELVPAFLDAVPTDPFDGRPLRYQPAEDGTFRIYSVGPDGRDDGGVGSDPKRSREPPDLVF